MDIDTVLHSVLLQQNNLQKARVMKQSYCHQCEQQIL